MASSASPPLSPSHSGQDVSGFANFFRQTKLLLHKNWLTKKRMQIKKLIGELFQPILYLVVLAIIVQFDTPKEYERESQPFDTPTNVFSSFSFDFSSLNATHIHIAPDSNATRTLISTVDQIWQNQQNISDKNLSFIFHDTEDDLLSAYYNGDVQLAVIFTRTLSSMVEYKIRTSPDDFEFNLPALSNKKADLSTCRDLKEKSPFLELPSSCPVNSYFYTNFLALQSLVDTAILQNSQSNSVDIQVKVQNYPKPEYTPGTSILLRILIPMYTAFPIAQFINNLLILIVTEKEKKIKDGLKLIGVMDTAYWCSWFLFYGILLSIISIIFTIVLHFVQVIHNTDVIILFLLFFLFGLSIITFAFALSPFFHKPKTAGLVGTLALQLTSLLYMVQTFVAESSGALIPLKLFSSVAFTTAMDQACEFEYFGGIGWSDLGPNSKGSAVFSSLLFLIFDIVFYGLLAIYLDNVLPNEFGVRKHPLYLFKSSFWKQSSTTDENEGRNNQGFDNDEPEYEINAEDIEPIPSAMLSKRAAKISGVKKTYSVKKKMCGPSEEIKALKGISLDIYESQITAILGRNGAGKSTLFNIITGLALPTSGTCVVFGLNVTNPYDMSILRRIIGVCLQYDLHFDALTVEEHFQFYGQLRGIAPDIIVQEMEEIMSDLQLADQRNVAANKLSGGQKRKLSAGLALMGDPKVVLLDEPTAGVDPVSRRHLWSLLQRKKQGKMILLTTHFMDEADILADRKAIIQSGQLKCVGSSLFLKNRFGVGYYLTIEMENRDDETQECDSLIEKWIPSAVASKKVISNEVKYALPHSETKSFPGLFRDIESHIQTRDSPIQSYGVSMTTLEEVFLKLSLDHSNENEVEHTNFRNSQNSDDTSSSGNLFSTENDIEERNLIPKMVENFSTSRSATLKALILLRARRLQRSPQGIFFMIFMPVIFVAMGMGFYTTQNLTIDQDIVHFGPTDIYEKEDLNIAVHEQNPENENLTNFLIQYGFTVFPFSGEYSELLNINNQSDGTMAAISAKYELDSDSTWSLSALVNINGTYLHTPAVIMSALYKFAASQISTDLVSFGASSQPFLPRTPRTVDPTAFFTVFLIGPAFVFFGIGMVMELVNDREIKTRNHLRVNGLDFFTYIASLLILFTGLGFIVTILQLSMVFIFSIKAYTNIYAFVVLLVLLLLFIPTSLLLSSLFSYLFDTLEAAETVYGQLASWLGSLVGIAIIVLDSIYPDETVVYVVHYVACALDIFYIPFGAFYWVNKQYILCSIKDECDDLSFSNYTGMEIISMAGFMILQIPVYSFLLVVADVKKQGGSISDVFNIFKRRGPSYKQTKIGDVELSEDCRSEDVDPDITEEAGKVAEIFAGTVPSEKCVVAVQNLRKSYKVKKSKKNKTKGEKQVVKSISFKVEEGEVFGLLGHNGAGKTTAMKLITAEEHHDGGKILLCGYDISSNMSEAFSKLGYCPQHDALWDMITLREHIELYAIIRGIPLSQRKTLVSHFLKGLQIEEHADKKTNELSGGTKRKLTYALSMLGAPRIVLMDEPSTGMDPQSKRFMWNTVLGTFKDSRGAILTTHSMEEADALCSRIAIMVKGSLLCVGSPQHLKSKFGRGYTLEVKLKDDLSQKIESPTRGASEVRRRTSSFAVVPDEFKFLVTNFPGCKLNECFGNRAVFSLPISSISSIAEAFALLESLKVDHDVEEYSFSQTSLEQVFLSFSKEEDDVVEDNSS